MTYDLIVIGGGPAGYLACERAAHKGLKTLLIVESTVGGVCLNEGCIPTKTLLYSAKLAEGATHGKKYGVYADGICIHHEEVIKRKDRIVKLLTGGVLASLKGHGVDIVQARAEIKGKNSQGFEIIADEKVYVGQKLLIATGSKASVPPIPGVIENIKAGFVLTNREILSMTEIPKKLVIIGGGVIGLELASYFNSAGSEVTVIEMLEKVGGPIDSDISNLLKKAYMKKGVKFYLGCKVVSISEDKVCYEEKGEVKELGADKVLLSIGRTPNTTGLGLEQIGVKTERGSIVTDMYMKTNIPDVFAAGDVNGKSMLAHTAYREAEVAVNNMLGEVDVMKYEAIPSVIYTNPEVSGIGETEETAREKGIEYISKTVSMRYSGRYVAENEDGDGIIKLIVNKNQNKIIGMHMITNYASEIIYGASIIVQQELSIEDLKKIVFPHPTVSEIIREAIFSF